MVELGVRPPTLVPLDKNHGRQAVEGTVPVSPTLYCKVEVLCCQNTTIHVLLPEHVLVSP